MKTAMAAPPRTSAETAELSQLRQTRTAWGELFEPDVMRFPAVMLGVKTMWEGAERIVRSAFTNQRTAVKAGHSTSKDWSAGIVVLMWLLRYFPSKVILTAPTDRQVKYIMFEEIKKQCAALARHSPFPLPKDCVKTQMLDLGPEWFALGFTTRDTGEMIGKFQGFKSPNMLVVISEAQDVADNIYDQVEGILSSGNAHILEIGNPMSPEGKFWEHCSQPKFGYNVLSISCLDTPNYKARKELIPGMITYESVEYWRQIWGEEHPYWYGRVLGEFPQYGSDSIIPIAWIMRNINRHLKDQRFTEENDNLKVGGLDVSKGGTDETVHLVLSGKVVSKINAFHNVDINETVGWAKGLIREDDLKLYAVDEGGLAGVASFLEEEELPHLKFQFGGALEDNDDFLNLGAYAWWMLREAFQNNQISIPDDPILIGQLAKRRYEYTSVGKKRIKLESKKEARSLRGEHSPDRADALAMAWYARMIAIGSGVEIGAADAVSDSGQLQESVEGIYPRRGVGRHATEESSDSIGGGRMDADRL